MTKFSKNATIKGQFKNVSFTDNTLTDTDTGELIDFIKICSEVFGDMPVDIIVTAKQNDDLD